MIKEDKQLLLKDLCARLPYGVQIHYHWSVGDNVIDEDREIDFSDVETLKYTIEEPQKPSELITISFMPYLRPISSMTVKEMREFLFSIKSGECKGFPLTVDKQDWLNEHHFDYRGLIPMGLALEAPEGMYKED